MKILLINGSPKGEASDTLVLSKAFLDGMDEAYERIDLIEKTVAPCMACLSCWHITPGVCVQRDDAGALLSKIVEADMVVWSMPLYCYGMPSHVKALVDRLLPLSTQVQFADAEGHTHHKTSGEISTSHMLISGCGFPDYKGNFDALVLQFKRLFGAGSQMILCAEAPMLSVKEAEPVTRPYLEAVRRAGREFAQCGVISADVSQILETPMLDPEVYRLLSSGASKTPVSPEI